MEVATELPQFHFFPQLPKDIQLKIYERTDVPSVCRFYAACASDPAYKVTCRDAAYYFARKVVEVTPEVVVTGDHRQIDFHTYGMLPPCEIQVTTPVGLLALTKWHLTQVKAKRVSLKIVNDVQQRVPCKLLGLGDNVVALSIEGGVGKIEIDPQASPLSVEKLTARSTIYKVAPDLRHLTNLVRYDSYDYDLSHPNNVIMTRPRVSQLPSSLTTYNGNLQTDLSTQELPNLKHFDGHSLSDALWNQVETAKVRELNPRGRFSQLCEITISRGYPSFKGCDCPQLKKVEFRDSYSRDGRTPHISGLFTTAQQAQLVSLKGEALVVTDMALFKNLEVLQMSLKEPLTADFPLPPKLKELKIRSNSSVVGIPATLEVFEYRNHLGPTRDVVVASPNLRQLRVTHAERLTIECPILTSLEMWFVGELGALEVPNLEKLGAKYVPIPLNVHGVPIPLERLSRLNHLSLSGEYTPISGSTPRFDHAQRVVIGHRLKSVTLEGMKLSEVSISSDEVTIEGCSFSDTPRIRATALKVLILDFDTSDVVCRELKCWKIDERAVPQMVEKLIIGEVNLYRDPLSNSLVHDYYPLALDGCDRLRSVYIRGFSPAEGLNYKFSFAASIEQVRIGVKALGDFAEVRFAEDTQLEHLECWAVASKEQLGITEYPPSCYFPQGVRTETGTDHPELQESKLRQH